MSHYIDSLDDMEGVVREDKGGLSTQSQPHFDSLVMDLPLPAGSHTGSAAKSRLTIVEQVSFISPEDPPKSDENRWSIPISSDEQPYGRKTRATPEWKPLDCGWVKECSVLIIYNLEGKNRQKIPTEEEKAETASKVLELALDGTHIASIAIPPGSSIRITPIDCTAISIRSACGLLQYSYTLYPK